MTSLGCAVNVYQDNYALPGLLENASRFFDDIFIIHAGPAGKKSTDGTIETIEKWGIKHVFDDMAHGFGVIRTRLIHGSSTEWVMILDADERFNPVCPVISCEGSEQYPDVPMPNLTTTIHEPIFDQGSLLKEKINAGGFDAIRTLRRHWFDFSWKRPCQNFQTGLDWQLRIVRNLPHIGFAPGRKMHELLTNLSTGGGVHVFGNDDTTKTFFHDHYHCWFKPMESGNNAEDMQTYRLLDENATEEMWLNAATGVDTGLSR